MTRILAAVGAMALLANPTFAFAQSTPSTDMPSSGAPQSSGATAPDATATDTQNMQSHPRRSAHGVHHVAMQREGSEERVTAALNALEAQGYTTWHDVQPEGQNVVAYATKDGKEAHVEVTPSGQVNPTT
ncbi:MAG TPA: hypothetical protein VNT30_20950 [Stellaceae bacterium]|nr:hypothetical protein [Stellaceae bacterium]